MSWFGSRIESGLSDWQILQRDADGFTSVTLRGAWKLPPGDGHAIPAVVVVRVMTEATHAPVGGGTGWLTTQTHEDGTWEHTLRIPQGGLYRIESALRMLPPEGLEWSCHGDAIHHVGVGDLWVVAGQSNAAGYGHGPALDAPELGVHSLRNDETWSLATHPLNHPRGSERANSEFHNPAHSPFLAFAKELKKELGYPIGLIQTAMGGSWLHSWNLGDDPEAPLYLNMLHCVKLAGGRVRGVVWYQGESDASTESSCDTYVQRFLDFVKDMRRDFKDPALPVLTAQLNRYQSTLSPADADRSNLGWCRIREAQRVLAHHPGIAVVPTLDLGLSDLIHNSAGANLALAHRFVLSALGAAYGRDVIHRFPEIAKAARDGDNAINLTFDHVANPLTSTQTLIEQFVVADAAGVVPIEATKITTRDTIRLTFARPLQMPARVHGSAGTNPPQQVFENEASRPLLGFHGFPVA